MRSLALFALFGLLALEASAEPSGSIFEVEDFNELPPEVEILSTSEEGGVILDEITFAGAPFNGRPTRIYGYYARPAGAGKFPGILEIHGNGMGVLPSKKAIYYAQNGFACFSMDWAGPAAERSNPRKPPYSEFVSPGSRAKKLEDGQYAIHGVEVDAITNGVRFARRSLEFLRNQKEVDSAQMFVSGTSAGAHLTLLLLGLDDKIKGAVVKYGCGFVRDLPQYYGGYFKTISYAPESEQDTWLKALDPKHRLSSIRANVLMLSGTNDAFFWMPVVLKTYRELPPPKHLIMFPNDNHRHVDDEIVPMQFFKSILGLAPSFPVPQPPETAIENGGLVLRTHVTSEAALAKVSFVVKRMPRSEFQWMEAPPWDVIPATLKDGAWVATIADVEPGEQIVIYAHAEDTLGRPGSSDTTEIPAYPQWRGLKH